MTPDIDIWPPPRCPFIGSPLIFLAIDIEEIASRFIIRHFCGYYVLSNSPNWKIFSIISTFGVISGQNVGFWPPGVPIYRVPPNSYAIDIEDIASRFNINVFCGYQVLPNGPNWKDLGSLWAKIWVFDPLQCSLIGFPSIVMHLIMKIYYQGLT